MQINLRTIEKFISENSLKETGFCFACGMSRSWLSKIRARDLSPDVEIILRPKARKRVEAILKGEVKIPKLAVRVTRSLQNSPPCDPEHDILHLIVLIAKEGKPITWSSFRELCHADWALRTKMESLGLNTEVLAPFS